MSDDFYASIPCGVNEALRSVGWANKSFFAARFSLNEFFLSPLSVSDAPFTVKILEGKSRILVDSIPQRVIVERHM